MIHVLSLLVAPALPAQVNPQPRSFAELVMASGFIGPLLALASLLAVGMVVARWRELRLQRLAPSSLQRSLEGALHRAELDAGLDHAVASQTLLGDLVAAGLHLRRAGLDEMLANVERATSRESMRLGNRVANLARLGGVVLLVGLLGTTVSLMSALEVIGVLEAPTVNDFAQGIQQALVCVVLGIGAALFSFAAFFWLDARLTQRTLAVREVAEELVRDAAEKI
jgi:biopolymer transport protein ExbB